MIQNRFNELFLQFSDLSEALLGYREGEVDKMLAKILELQVIAKNHRRNDEVETLFEIIHNLNEIVIDIEE